MNNERKLRIPFATVAGGADLKMVSVNGRTRSRTLSYSVLQSIVLSPAVVCSMW